MQLWKKISELTVTKALKLAKGVSLTFTDPNGVETRFNPFVKTLTAASTLPESESGMTYLLNSATEFATTLPPVKAGLRYTFVVGAAPDGANYTVVTNGSANIIKGFATNAAGAAVTPLGDGDTISFVASQAVAGDQVTVFCDGTNWIMSGFAQVAAGITNTKAS